MFAARWKIIMSPELDQSVSAHILERAVAQAKALTAEMSEKHITDLIEEAVQWAREH